MSGGVTPAARQPAPGERVEPERPPVRPAPPRRDGPQDPAPAPASAEPRDTPEAPRAPGAPAAPAAPRAAPAAPGAPPESTGTPPPDIPPAAVERATTLVRELLDETRALADRGLTVQPDLAAAEGPARTRRDMTVRDLAAAAFGVERPEAVTEAQLEAVRRLNPELTGDRVPRDTTVRLNGTPTALRLAERHLELARVHLEHAQPTEHTQAQREAVARRLAEVRGMQQAHAITRRIHEAHDTVDRLVREATPPNGRMDPRRLEGAAPRFELIRGEIAQRERAGDLTAEQARIARQQVDMAEVRAQVRTASALSGRYTEHLQELDRRAANPGPEPSAAVYHLNQAARYVRERREPTVRGIEQATQAARARLEELRRNAPESARGEIDASLAAIEAERRRALAHVHVASQDPAAAERLYLPPSLTASGEVLRPTRGLRYGTDGQPLAGRQFFTAGTHVGALTEARRDEITRRIMALPEAERRAAAEGMLALADVYASADDRGRLNAARQVLAATASQLGDPSISVRSRFVQARFQTRIQSFEGARRELEAAAAEARQLGDRGRELQAQATLGLIAAHRSEAATASDEAARRAAADRLRTMRQGLERDPQGLTRDQVARLGFLEAQTFLQQQRPHEARDTMRHVQERYRDLPDVAAAMRAYERDNTEAGITAALKVALRASNSGSTGLMVGSTLGAGAVGAGVGFMIGGPPGAGIGFIVGSGVGALGASAYSAARSWDQVTAAFDTGLTSLTWSDAVTDAAFLGLNLAAAATPAGGFARIAPLGGARALLRPSAQVVEALERSTAALGVTATREEIEREARGVVMRAFTEGTLAFGGRPLAGAAVTAMVGPLGVEWARIAAMPDGPEKQDAQRRFSENLTSGALITAAALGSSVLAARLARNAGTRWPTTLEAAPPLSGPALRGAPPDGAPVPPRPPGEAAPVTGPRAQAYRELERLIQSTGDRVPTTAEGAAFRRYIEESATDLPPDQRAGYAERVWERMQARRAAEIEVGGAPNAPFDPGAVLRRVADRLQAARFGGRRPMAPGEPSPVRTAIEEEAHLAIQAALRAADPGTVPYAARAAAFDDLTSLEIAERLAINRGNAAPVRRIAAELGTLRRAGEEGGLTTAQLDEARAELNTALRRHGLSTEDAGRVIASVQREAFERATAARLAREQEGRATPLSDADISRITSEVAQRVGLGRDAAALVRDVVGRPGFTDWVRSQRSPAHWTPEMRRDQFLTYASPEVRVEMGQLSATEMSAIFGDRPIPHVVAEFADIPGFANFARANPEGARTLTQAAILYPTRVRPYIEANGFGTAAREYAGHVPSVEPHPTIPNHMLLRRGPNAPNWLPEYEIIPNNAHDHNGAFYSSGEVPGRFAGRRFMPSSFPRYDGLRPDQLRVNGQPLTSLDGVMVFGAHGWHGSIGGLSPTRAATALVDHIASLPPERRPRHIVLSSCYQVDRRGLVAGPSNGGLVRAHVERLLRERGLPPVNVMVSDTPGAMVGVGHRTRFRYGYDFQSGRLRTERDWFPATFRNDNGARTNIPNGLVWALAGEAAVLAAMPFAIDWYTRRRD